MANLDAAFGLNPVGSISGGANQKLNEYKIASNEANAIFQGRHGTARFLAISSKLEQVRQTLVFFGVVNSTTQQLNKPTFKNHSAASGN